MLAIYSVIAYNISNYVQAHKRRKKDVLMTVLCKLKRYMAICLVVSFMTGALCVPAYADELSTDAETESAGTEDVNVSAEDAGSGSGDDQAPETEGDALPEAEEDGEAGTEEEISLPTGLVNEDGVLRYYYEGGVLASGSWITDQESGCTYYALDDGTIAAGRFIHFGEQAYYALESGAMASGVFESGGRMYYSDPEALCLRRDPGWVSQDGNTYYVLGNGILATGFASVGGSKYHFGRDGVMSTGFFEAEGRLRYSDPATGIVRVSAGWLTVEGERYFSDANGYFYRDRFISFGDHGFFVGHDGRVLRTQEEIMDGYGILYVLKDDTGEIPLGWYTDAAGDRYYQRSSGAATGDVVMDHRKYRFDKETGKLISLSGIDISEWQGDIDWAAVKADGIDFVFIRIGGRGGSSGLLYADDAAERNIRGALAAGLKVGVYFFTQAVSVDEARAEARYVIDKIKGFDITMPVAIDTEEILTGSRHNWISPATRTAVVLAFCDEIAKAGYTPMIYASASYFQDWWLHDSKLKDILHWVAEIYGDPDRHNNCSYTGETACWQYSWEGSVAGIGYDVDMNIWYMNVMMPWIRETV